MLVVMGGDNVWEVVVCGCAEECVGWKRADDGSARGSCVGMIDCGCGCVDDSDGSEANG